MNDDRESELLSAYLDGQLSGDECARGEDLLATKPAARKLLDELRSIGAALKSLPRQKLGEDLSGSVLLIAQRRKSAESAERTEPDETEKDAMAEPKASVEPSPIYSTIFRRLKNPRLWAWEIVIAAVAVLLMVYYPGRNADSGRQASADRSIAMTTKPSGEPAASPSSEIRAAPAFVTPASAAAQQKESVNLVGSVGVQATTPGETASARKSGEEADKADRLGGVLDNEKPAEERLADQRQNAAINGADSENKERATLQEKLATKTLPSHAFGSVPTGTTAEAQSVEPDSSPASPSAGLIVEGKVKPGAASAGGAAIVSKSMSQIQPAKQPAGQESAEAEKAPVASGGELIVVRCQVAPSVLEGHVFDKILAENAIVWSDEQTEHSAAEDLPARDAIGARSEARSDVPQDKPKTAQAHGQAFRREVNEAVAADEGGFSMAGPVQMVYVEASPAQIEATLKGLSAQAGVFKNVSVASATGESQLAVAVDGVDSRAGLFKAGEAAGARASRSLQSAGNRLQFQTGGDASASAHEALGRARRGPLADVNNVKQATSTDGLQQGIGDDIKKGLPGAVDYGAMIAGRASDVKSTGQLTFDSNSQPSTSTATAQMQRVLFVFEVADEKNAAAGRDVNAPADASGVAAPAADADRSKP